MKTLGYIISKRKIKEKVNFVEVVDNIEKIDEPTKPFIIIGMNEAKKLVDDFNALEKQLDEDVFWTFSKTERRVDYERDLENFYDYILYKNINNIKYYYINILNIKYNKIKKLINIINSKDKKYIYISKNMIYIYYNNNILGLSIKIMKYINLKIDKIIKKIRNNSNNIIYTNDYFLDERIKNMITNKKYVIPYFMSIKE